MPNTLTLSTSGPSPDPLNVPNNDRQVIIDNQLGAEVTFTLDPAGFLNPSQGTTLAVPAGQTTVTAGASGRYSYNDPDSNKRATRNGRINVE